MEFWAFFQANFYPLTTALLRNFQPLSWLEIAAFQLVRKTKSSTPAIIRVSQIWVLCSFATITTTRGFSMASISTLSSILLGSWEPAQRFTTSGHFGKGRSGWFCTHKCKMWDSCPSHRPSETSWAGLYGRVNICRPPALFRPADVLYCIGTKSKGQACVLAWPVKVSSEHTRRWKCAPGWGRLPPPESHYKKETICRKAAEGHWKRSLFIERPAADEESRKRRRQADLRPGTCGTRRMDSVFPGFVWLCLAQVAIAFPSVN